MSKSSICGSREGHARNFRLRNRAYPFHSHYQGDTQSSPVASEPVHGAKNCRKQITVSVIQILGNYRYNLLWPIAWHLQPGVSDSLACDAASSRNIEETWRGHTRQGAPIHCALWALRAQCGTDVSASVPRERREWMVVSPVLGETTSRFASLGGNDYAHRAMHVTVHRVCLVTPL